MMRKAILFLGGVAVAMLFILMQLLFMVREGDAVVVTTFGQPVRGITDAGLYTRWPWPIQRVYRFDQRIQSFEGPFEQVLTSDGKNILVAVYAGWQIMEPISFLERVGTLEQAERSIEGLLRSYTSGTLGRYPFASLVNVNPEAIRFEAIEAEILDALQVEAEDRYGIRVSFLGIRRIGLPESITERVFERMRAERTELAERYRSEGESEALRIRAAADSEREQVLARATADTQRIRAEGEAAAADAYRVFHDHPDFALFLRKLDVLETVLTNQATVVLSSEMEPFDLLKGPGAWE